MRQFVLLPLLRGWSIIPERGRIMLWSDHGWHLGEKGHWHKRTLWEEATRVPLIVVTPDHGRPGQPCHQPASLVDLYPTLIELCGLSQVRGLDQESISLRSTTLCMDTPAQRQNH
jgi:arylsulfatase A-like enzyme